MAEGTCVFDGCENPSRRRRLCDKHWQSEKAAGRLELWPKVKILADHCGVDGCPDPVKAKGFCRRHYWHDWMHGYPEKATFEERFWAMVNKDGSIPEYRPDLCPCWEWTGSTTHGGYGCFRWTEKVRRAHVIAYELLVGLVPEGLELDHLCRNPRCVNPAHLEPVTHAENMRRARDARMAHIDDAEVERRWCLGQSQKAIAEALGCSSWTVRRIATERGLPERHLR